MHQALIPLLFAAVVLSGCAGEARTATNQPTQAADTPRAPKTTEAAQTPPSPSAADKQAAKPAEPTKAAKGVVVKTAGSEFGEMLFDNSGRAIYLFDKETTTKPECYGACAKAWPPVLTEGDPQASNQTRSGLLGTTRRDDGSTQVTYAGQPLYFYAHEGKNQVLCHNVSEFGGVWLVVTPSGEPAD